MKHGEIPGSLPLGKDESEIPAVTAGSLQENPDMAAGKARITAQQYERARSMIEWAKDYYRIKVRPKNQFSTFRIEHLTENDSIQITGRLADGSWGTQQWLINKGDVRLEKGKLVADDERIQNAIDHMYR
jgi:hypothetical protein